MQVARKIYRRAKEYGLRDEDIFIDCLVKTARCSTRTGDGTIKAVKMIKEELGVATVPGSQQRSHDCRPGYIKFHLPGNGLAAGLDYP